MSSFNISDLKDIVLDSFGRGKASLLERLEHLIDSTYNRTDDAGGGGGLSLGETSGTAYRGDRGKTAYDHSQAAHETPGAAGSYFWTLAPINKAATATGFGVPTGTTGLFSGTVSGVALNTASLKFGIAFISTTGTPTIRVAQIRKFS